ncbi:MULTISPECIES: TRAP transporter substrate-binding protein [unclassified Herbaspirillum]|uniref:TRAP transporter substrate-binding protein n=1 Tax=unclassified Herbaspirillum TaxID=2624150 RepID=UPI00114D9E5B|nr:MULTISPECIES: TRAP transporter substrate-binding protein [unclassified Herbaspirillum]MBB5390686.1 tripartite ATP-independent transporter DctP family solute receptor [Herbaspirillum sp. SJZ102]TQK08828.1 tripartite ATP-independent transporter DctP family solute receptor [Herbaspirillum sp. SJZ130]TQK14485.1 tripartite ATP-independent transporter DctP family solute receptor [Herbaspirillum sp. SJZ106]
MNHFNSRRDFLKTASAASLALAAGSWSQRANAAEFVLKYANNLAMTHPMNIRAAEMAKEISEQSKGRIELQIYPNNQLGGDTDMLAQVRSGAIDMFTLSSLTLGTLVPVAQISGMGFAFKDYDTVWAALDGDLGAHMRQEIQGKSTLFAFEKIWDNGYRQITNNAKPIRNPDDLKGMKLRVPPSPLWTSMFKALGVSPTSINFAEVYSALQTGIVQGQENPLAIIYTGKLYEVQKYCSLTNHMWDGFWMLGNKKSFERLPRDLQEIVRANVNAAGVKQREDVRKLNESLAGELKARGIQLNDADHEAFHARLRQVKFYDEWHKKFGDQAWSILEKYSGKLS